MPVYSVSQVAFYLRDILGRDRLLQDLWVSGEVANLSRPGSGHSYFTLREANTSLRCVMFRDAIGAERLGNGASVIVHGRISIYTVRGELQFVADMVQPEGVGELQLKLEQLKLKLEREGLFEPTRKRSLPRFPRRIAVITSPSGAVWRDILNVLARRYPLIELLLTSTPVQGENAAPGIVEAFKRLNEIQDVDVVLLARGGGSLEDLWPFNEEVVARAVYASRAPVISAVGHDTDVTIADLVADRRAPTPSAAAEMAVPDLLELSSRVFAARQALQTRISQYAAARSDSFEQLERRLQRGGPDLDTLRGSIDYLLKRAATHLSHNRTLKAERFDGLKMRLESLSPVQTLRRGYAIVQRTVDGMVISESAQVGPREPIRVTLNRGVLDAEVTSADSAGVSREVGTAYDVERDL